MSRRELQPCGTYAAYQRHLLASEEPCEACKQAAREYRRAYRKVAPRGLADTTKARMRARSRARIKLSRLYRTAYEDLLAKELAKEGITP